VALSAVSAHLVLRSKDACLPKGYFLFTERHRLNMADYFSLVLIMQY